MQYPKVNLSIHPAIEFGTAGIHIQDLRDDEYVRGAIASARNREVENSNKTVFHKGINGIQWSYMMNLHNRGVNRENDAITRQGIESFRNKLSHLLSEEFSGKTVKH